MARSRGSSNSPDVVDVTMVILAFESINKVKVEIRIGREDVGLASDLLVSAIAHVEMGEIGGVPPLASVSVRCSATNLRTLDAAVLHALYQLDFQLGKAEFEKAGTKKA